MSSRHAPGPPAPGPPSPAPPAPSPGTRPELLAPAGDRDALKAALLAGADAVYLAGLRFGARASAPNFDAGGLAWARRVTRARHRRLYVAVNTLVDERQWGDLEAHLEGLVSLGVDAVIVQDLAVLTTLRRTEDALGIPTHRRLRAHLSTQAAWDGAGGARGAAALAELGVTRVVLPRETPLVTVRDLCAQGPFEVEVFVHGAHCYSVSGRCWWSAALGPRSGNRGTCAQPCRRAYEARDAPPGSAARTPWLSPRDLRLLDHVPALARAGVTSLKIEGRLKDATYVSAVTRTYRAALDATAAAPTPPGHADLDGVFGRAWIPGFLDAPPTDWSTPDSVGSAGEEVGVVRQVDAGDGRVALTLHRALAPGDGLVWDAALNAAAETTRPSARVTWVDEETVGNRLVRLRGHRPHRAGVTIRRTDRGRPAVPLAGWDPAWEARPVTLRFCGQNGAPLTIEATIEATGEATSEATSEATGEATGEDRTVICASKPLLEPARGQGLEALLEDRGGLFGPVFGQDGGRDASRDPGDAFRVVSLDATGLAPGLFLPPKGLKALRRDLVTALRRSLPAPEPTRVACSSLETQAGSDTPRPDPTTWIRLWRRADLAPLADLHPTGGWILPATDASRPDDDALGRPVRYWLPPLFGPDAAARLAPLVAPLPPDELLCLSWEAFALAERFGDRRFRLDWTFNVTNARAAAWLARQGFAVTTAPEAPLPIPGAVALWRINPLVSLSRFPPAADAPSHFVNSHGDHFHRHPLTPGCWALFLEHLPPAPPATPLGSPPSLQVDVFEPTAKHAEATRTTLLTLPGVLPPDVHPRR